MAKLKIREKGSRIVNDICARVKRIPERLVDDISNLRLSFRQKGENISATLHAQAYPRSRRRKYVVHLPPGYTRQRPVPLVMVLHGCEQCNEKIQNISNFDAIADRAGFIVVYPFVTSYPGFRIKNCWGWWSKNQIESGGGEVEDLWSIIEQVKSEYNIDSKRIHVTGLSSGAAMATAMMVVHGHKIASGATVAGVPYAETQRTINTFINGWQRFRPIKEVSGAILKAMGDNRRFAPIFVIHSYDDNVIDIEAARNMRDSWAISFEFDLSKRAKVRSGTTKGVFWLHTKYRQSIKRSHIETLFVEGLGHGWFGGNPGEFSYPEGPNISKMIWKFFDTHRH